MSVASWRCQLHARTVFAHLSTAVIHQRSSRALQQLTNLKTVACTASTRVECTSSSAAPRQDSSDRVQCHATAQCDRVPSRRHWTRQHTHRMASTAQSDPVSSNSSSTSGRRLIVYSKDGCHLCDSLKKKLDALLSRAQFQASPLSGATLEVRDITAREDWFQKYQYEIPVLTYLDEEDRECEVPRASPRVTADRLEKHIVASISAS